MYIKHILCSLLLAVPLVVSKNHKTIKSYNDYKIVQIPKGALSEKDLRSMHVFGKSSNKVDLLVSPEELVQAKHRLQGDLVIVENNVQRLIDQERAQNDANRYKAASASDWFNSYHTYEEIYKWYEDLSKASPQIVSFNPSIGKSVNGAKIPAVVITDTSSTQPKTKFYFESLIHAREWISGTTTAFLANYLVESYNKNDKKIKELLGKIELHIVPVVNPDGYKYSWDHDRLWRKNMGAKKLGVDLNRNFPFRWGFRGAGTLPKDIDYRGPSAASEPEVKAVMKYFNSILPVGGAIDFHAYGQLMLRPYGHTQDSSPDETNFKTMTDKMGSLVTRTPYVSQKSSELYLVTGTSGDWFYRRGVGEKSVTKCYGMSIELSPESDEQGGFILSPDQIPIVGKDMIAPVLHFFDFVMKHPIA